MIYIHRTIEYKIREFNTFFKVVLVTGARQVGKTTLLEHLSKSEKNKRTYVSLDNPVIRTLAQEDPILFFQTYPLPVLIDEVQYAPQLFPIIKSLVDASDERGQVWLTGPQQYKLMKNVEESLAGRVGITNLYSLTKNEKDNVVFDSPLDFSLSSLLERKKKVESNSISNIFNHIWSGGMPQVLETGSQMLREAYLNSYIETYFIRDVRELYGVVETQKFSKFVRVCAALSTEQINYKTLAETTGIAQATAKEWLDILVGLGIIYLLKPFANNELKRLAKTPKMYFCDTGLCAYLSMWLTKEALMHGAVSGRYFENYVVMELVKNYSYSEQQVNFTYFRDSNKKEIDLFIEMGQTIHPLEIKLSAMPKKAEVRKFEILDKISLARGNGGIICMTDEVIPIDEKNNLIPCNIL